MKAERISSGLWAWVILSALIIGACSSGVPGDPSTGRQVSQLIYGVDNRTEAPGGVEPGALAAFDATGALISESAVMLTDDGSCELNIGSMTAGMKYRLCNDVAFRDQPVLAFCSGVLVARDVVATAGHCFDTRRCIDTAFVFGFTVEGESVRTEYSADDVYRCSAVLESGAGETDYALIRLDRPVRHHPIASTRRHGALAVSTPLTMFGHPLGLPMKRTGGASVRDISSATQFRADLDAFEGNSGSPVYSDLWTLEGVLVAGNPDHLLDSQRDCYADNICPGTGCAGTSEAWETVTRSSIVSHLVVQSGAPGWAISQFVSGSYAGRTFYAPGHLGEDHAAEPGTPVVAIADGWVVPSPISGAHCNYGIVVVIEHELPPDIAAEEGYTHAVSVYGHLSNRAGLEPVLSGYVRRGDVIGYVAHSGGSPPAGARCVDDDENGDGGPHLHLGLRFGPAAQDASGALAWKYFGYVGNGESRREDGGLWDSMQSFTLRHCAHAIGAGAESADAIRAFIAGDSRSRTSDTSLGCPMDAGTFFDGSMDEIHDWDGVAVQNFWQPNENRRFSGSAGDTALVASAATSNSAFLIRSGFWAVYKCLGGGPPSLLSGPDLLGAPRSEEEVCGADFNPGCPFGLFTTDCNEGVTRQLFERGYLDYGCPQLDTDGNGYGDSADERCLECAADPDSHSDCDEVGPKVHVHLCSHSDELALRGRLGAIEACADGLVGVVANPPQATGGVVAPAINGPATALLGSTLDLYLSGLTLNGGYILEAEVSTGGSTIEVETGTATGAGTAFPSVRLDAPFTFGEYRFVVQDLTTGQSSANFIVRVSDAAVRVSPSANPNLLTNCLDEGGSGFPPGSEITLVFEDPRAGATARDNVVVADPNGEFEWWFGLGAGCDAAAQGRATAYIDRVDPGGVGFSGRPARYWAEYWGGGQQTTPVVEYTLSVGGNCIPACGAAECGSDGCGGSCGTCSGTDVCGGSACAALGSSPTVVCGELAGDEHWTLADSPVRVNCDVTVTGSLTIDPGVVVAFAGSDDSIVVSDGGELDVGSLGGNDVVFQSATNATAGAWGSVQIYASAGAVTIENAMFRHGGNADEGGAPLYFNPRVATPPVFRGLLFEGNTINGIILPSGTYSTDAHIPTSNAAYWLPNDLTISEAATLTIDAGVVIKMGFQYADIRVGGRLVANGTGTAPVVFTSAKDDARSGDTNADGATAPRQQNWGGIYFANNTTLPNSELHNVVVAYGGEDDTYYPGTDNPTFGYPILIHPYENPVFDNVQFVANRVNTQALIAGTRSSDVHLDIIGTPYWIPNDITIAEASTWTIDAGVVLKMGYGYSDWTVRGRLVANGTPSQPVVFTSSTDDDRGGDSNQDGNTAPGPQGWGGIYIAPESLLAPSELHHVIVAYGGQDDTDYGANPDNATCGYPIRLHGYANPVFDDVRFESNRIDGQGLVTGTYSSNVHLDLTGYPYWVASDITIGDASTWTIDAGVVLKMGYGYADWRVQGRLVTNGTPARPVVFTSRYDDARGGDTNTDGATSPGPQNWGGIYFSENTTLPRSELHNTIIAYAGQDDTDYGANPDNATCGYPILVHGYADPWFEGVVFESNRIDTQGLVTGEYSRDVHLDLAGYPYYVASDLTIADGGTWTINPGVVLKFAYSHADLIVNGRLLANGEPDALVVFTSSRDDARGGDSNTDGATAPGSSNWGGVYFAAEGLLPSSELHNTVVAYAGRSGWDYNASPDNYARGYPIEIHPYANPVFSNVSLESNRYDAVRLRPGSFSSNATLDMTEWPYWIDNDITIGSAATWTVVPGASFKFGYTYADIDVRGRLLAEGTPDAPIVFTSRRDDSIVGDSNRDGATAPQPADWGGIYFASGSLLAESKISNAVIAYGGQGGIDWNSSPDNPTYNYALRVAAETGLRLEGVTFVDNDDAVRVQGNGVVDLGGGPYGSTGGNRFFGHFGVDDSWALANITDRDVFAYFNDWDRQRSTAAIESMLYDDTDDAAYGEVLWDYYVCGDGTRTGSETCDGADLGGVGCGDVGFDGGELMCAADCSLFITTACTTCGDLAVEGVEVCDATNLAGRTCEDFGFDDGTLLCAADCAEFAMGGCYLCGDGTCNATTENTTNCYEDCGSRCGDGALNGEELCEVGYVHSTCADEGFDGGTLGCGPMCDAYNTRNCTRCGDGTCEGDESSLTCFEDCGGTCNDGVCQADESAVSCPGDCPAVCGDGDVTHDEDCDGAVGVEVTCQALAFAGGTLVCSGCAFDTSACWYCGDSTVNPGEECDEGPLNSDIEADACRTDCNAPACGDGVVDDGEECDAGKNNDDVEADACRTDCTSPTCGDGVIDDGEECDDGEDNHDFLTDACRTNCEFAWCGDGVIDTGEQCDNADGNSDELSDACRTACRFPLCGDGVVDSGEVCDLGLVNSDVAADVCRTTCELPVCGDGVADTGEGCDDGILNSDVLSGACRTDCRPASCGDGIIDHGEGCDDGVLNDNLAPDACREACEPAHCGDGVRDTGEQCDQGDGNSDNAANTCRTSCALPSCGDGIIDSGETCDDGSANDDAVPGACRTDCSVARCGDGVRDPGEACDDGPDNSDTRPGTCRLDCSSGVCGDGRLDSGEECDDGEANSDIAADACRTSCRFTACGDGVIDADETCDNGAANSDMIADACRTSCQPAACGDGVVDAGEACDDGDTNSYAVDACRPGCIAPACGDGAQDSMEECDDGELNSNIDADACRIDCVAATCGDGILDSAEDCDAGELNSDREPDTCREDCVEAACGDGVIDSGESCDDGDDNSGLDPGACRTDCALPTCGDGIIDPGEVCDNASANSDVRPDACRTTCVLSWCGDDVRDSSEACDDGVSNSDIDSDACRLDCGLPFCGDGVVDSNEECDDGRDNSSARPDACRDDCRAPRCGDGVVDGAEECDRGASNGGSSPGDCISTCTVVPGPSVDAGDDFGWNDVGDSGGPTDAGSVSETGDANDILDSTDDATGNIDSTSDAEVDNGDVWVDGASGADISEFDTAEDSGGPSLVDADGGDGRGAGRHDGCSASPGRIDYAHWLLGLLALACLHRVWGRTRSRGG